MKITAFLRFFAVFAVLTASGSGFSQNVNEKLITSINVPNIMGDVYSFKYDSKTGGWVYNAYDTSAQTSVLVTPKGTSKPYNMIMQYFSLFDSEGNSYTVVSENASDTTSNYFVLKNHEQVSPAYRFINEGWSMKNGIIYFSASEADKSYLVSYNTKTGEFTNSKPYDEVRLVYIPVYYAEGEPMGEVGFTKSGEPYFVGVDATGARLVIGTAEQKVYSDIMYWDVKFDSNGEPVYIAKDQGKFYQERGNTFVVHGTKEFKKFDYVYGPVILDNQNNAVYVGQDSTGEYIYRSALMRENEVLKTTDGSFYSYMMTPNGKLAYIETVNGTNPNDPNSGYSMVVVDGKAGKQYSSIGMLKFSPSSSPLYTVTDKKNKSFLISGTEQAAGKYDYFADFGYTANGKLFYIGTNYGNYETKKPDKNIVSVDGEEFGPYDFVYTSDYKTNTIVQSDIKGNFAFVAGKNTDFENYVYKYKVITNSWESKDFDAINEMRLLNGKVYFFGGTDTKRGSYIYTYKLYANNKAISGDYGSVSEVNITDGGVYTFLAAKDKGMYMVDVK